MLANSLHDRFGSSMLRGKAEAELCIVCRLTAGLPTGSHRAQEDCPVRVPSEGAEEEGCHSLDVPQPRRRSMVPSVGALEQVWPAGSHQGASS